MLQSAAADTADTPLLAVDCSMTATQQCSADVDRRRGVEYSA